MVMREEDERRGWRQVGIDWLSSILAVVWLYSIEYGYTLLVE